MISFLGVWIARSPTRRQEVLPGAAPHALTREARLRATPLLDPSGLRGVFRQPAVERAAGNDGLCVRRVDQLAGEQLRSTLVPLTLCPAAL
jgi:hypothetical protein